MSQVRKLQTGGKFRMNGRELSGQTAIDRLAAVYSGLPLDEREMFTVAQNAVKNGDTAEYDPTNNTITVTDSEGNNVTSKYTDTTASVKDSKFKRNWGATFNTRTHRFKKSGESMALVDMSDPNEVKDDSSKTVLRRGSKWWDFDPDSEGKLVYRENGAGNIDRMKVLDEHRAYFDQDEAATKDKYSLNGWSDSDIRSFRNYYKNVAGDTDESRQSYWDQLKDRIRTGKTTQADEEALGLLGFKKGAVGEGSDQEQSSGTPRIDSRWKGNIDAAKAAGIGIEQRDGHWYITGDNDYTRNNWYNGGLNFLAGTEFENGFTLNNGRLLTADEALNTQDIALKNILAPWMEANNPTYDTWNRRYDIFANSGIRFLGDRTGQSADYYGAFGNVWNPKTHYDPTWYDYFSKLGFKDYNVNVLTNSFDNIGNKQIISYIDPTKYNSVGVFSPQFVVYDPTNIENPYTMFNSENDMISSLGLNRSNYSKISTLDANRPWETIRNKDYAVQTSFGEAGKENTILRDRDGNYFIARKGPDGKPVSPKQIKNLDLMKEILANPNNYRNSDIADRLTKAPYNPANEVYGISQYNGHNFLFKDGGTVYKFQYGGAVGNSRTQLGEQKDLASAKTDITKAHALDGSDGGLTDAEWMQIGAAVGDLAGVGLSFVPVAGGVIGATTGAAASTTRFAADIKQDGFQSKDLWNYMGNLVLDAATLLPVVGTGAKAAKAAKIIKGIGKPLIKVLSIAGASAPVITAVSKIANGEKYTSADLAQAIQGIGSGIIAVKSIKGSIGEAKLAQKMAAREAETANTAIKEAKNINIHGFKDSATPQQLLDFVKDNPTEAKAIESIIKTAKAKNVELNADQAKDVLKAYGINITKGKININIKSAFKKGLVTRGEAGVNYEAPAEQNAGGWGKYLMPWNRSKVLGAEAVYGFGKNNGSLGKQINENDVKGAIRRMNEGKATLADQALLELTASNPQAFGKMFQSADNTRLNWKGRRVPIYTPVKSKGAVTLGGNRYWRVPYSAPTPVQPNYGGEASPLLPAVIGPRVESIPEYVPNFTFRNIDPTRAVSIYTTPIGNRLNAPRPLGREFQLPSYIGSRFQLPGTGASSGIIITPYTKALPYYQGVIQLPEHFKTGGKIQKFQSGGPAGNGWNVNWANLDDLKRAGATAGAIYKDRDIRRNALGELKKRQFITPHIDTLRYNFSDIDQSYNDQALPLLESKFVTSDSRDSMGFKLSKAQALSRLENQKNAAISQRMAAIDEQNRQIESTNAVNRAETANQKSQYLTGLEYQDDMLDSEALNRVFSDVLNPLGQQFGQQGRDAFNRKVDTNYKLAMADADKLENARISGDLNSKGYTAKWNALTPQERSQYSDISDYVYSQNPDDWKAIYSRSKAYQNNVNNAVGTYTRATGPLVFYKKGGNLRSAQEQIAINAAKQAQKSTAKLSDNLMKMLQQLTK